MSIKFSVEGEGSGVRRQRWSSAVGDATGGTVLVCDPVESVRLQRIRSAFSGC